MRTYETLPRFTVDLHRLTPAQRQRFHRAVLKAFVPDLRTGRHFHPGLRIKGVRSAPVGFQIPCRNLTADVASTSDMTSAVRPPRSEDWLTA